MIRIELTDEFAARLDAAAPVGIAALRYLGDFLIQQDSAQSLALAVGQAHADLCNLHAALQRGQRASVAALVVTHHPDGALVCDEHPPGGWLLNPLPPVQRDHYGARYLICEAISLSNAQRLCNGMGWSLRVAP